MAIEKMILLNMTFGKDDLKKVLFHLRETNDIYLQPSSKIVKKVKDVNELTASHQYDNLLERLTNLSKDIDLELNEDIHHNDSLNLTDVESFLEKNEYQVNEIKKVLNELIEEKNENEKTLKMLNHLHFTDIDLDNLLNCRYITVRFGRVPTKNIDSLKYYDGKPFIFYELGKDKEYVWCCYVVNNQLLLQIDNILKALSFEEIVIPEFVHGTIEQAITELNEQCLAMHEYILRVQQKLTALKETIKIDVLKIYSSLKYLSEVESYKENVVDFQSKYAIYGFISQRKLKDFKKLMNDCQCEYTELPSDILLQQDIVAPTIVHNSFWVKPFEFISQVKQSDSVDPTMAIAVLFYIVAVFFIGDLGIALLSLILGLLFRKKTIGKLFLALTPALLIGGLLYGSFFYEVQVYEDFLSIVPMIYRVVDGLVLLVSGVYTIRAIKNMCNESPLHDKILSINGVCGIVALAALLVYLLGVYEAHIHLSIIPIAVIIITCMILVIMKSVLKKEIK